MKTIKLVFLGSLVALLGACSNNNSGDGGTPTANGQACSASVPCANGQTLASLPACNASALTPFAPVGASMRIAQIPAGSYHYIGGAVFAESTNQNPQTSIEIIDDQPTNTAYPGTVSCVSNLSGTLPPFSTTGNISKNVQVVGSQFNLTSDRGISANYSNGNLQTLIFDRSDFQVKSAADMEAKQQTRESQGWSVNVYRVSANEFKIVLIQSVSGNGVTANLLIQARYSYAP